MDDGEGGLSFDFEGGLDTGPTHPTASVPVIQSTADATTASAVAVNVNNPSAAAAPAAQTAEGVGGGRRSFRQTVCRHWLRSLCWRYKFGFCPNGPDCRYRHAKLPGPPPPVEEVLQKIQQLASYNYGNSNRFSQNRNTSVAQQTEKSQFPQGQNGTNQVGKAGTAETTNVHQQPQQGQQSQQLGNQGQVQNHPNGQSNQANRTATPLPQGTSRYFVVKSCNRENLELSVQQGVWATQRSNEAKLNEAFDSVENVILIFSVNKTRHFQGCAKMTSRIGGSIGGGNWKHAHGTAHYGRNFAVKWLKLCELSFNKTRHLRNPYNENLPVKISRDCQELESSIGEQLASLLYLEPDSDLMAVSLAAEAKREEEKAKGVNPENGSENPDIVLFEDNEEEEEEESDEEDESVGPLFGAQGRGRGRGMMWPPHIPMARGARPFFAVRGFPPNMMGGDGFTYGPMNHDGFPMPNLFSMAPRGFAPYGPRFSGDFAGPMYPGRPSGGFGMMMGPGRAPFMGGIGVSAAAAMARGGRPVAIPPLYPPPPLPSQSSQNFNRAKRDQKVPTSDGNDSLDQGKGGKTQQDDPYGAGNSYRNDESESEDEAPRRSRHGEGKKKRRSLEADSTAISGEAM